MRLDAERRLDAEWSDPLQLSGVAHRSVLLTGARDVLVEAGEDEYADLVVVGPRGPGRFARMHIGSLAHQLAYYTPVRWRSFPPQALLLRSAEW